MYPNAHHPLFQLQHKTDQPRQSQAMMRHYAALHRRQWQNLYAKSLIKLANQGTRILVNTHSPYMLESLKIYSDKSNKSLGAKFYFSHKCENIIKIEDTNGNIVPIIDALSAPLYSLMEELEDVDNF